MRLIFLDIEANGFFPDTIWCVACIEEGVEHVFTRNLDLAAYLAEGPARIVAHNGYAYDYPWLQHLWDVDWSAHVLDDTIIRSQLAEPRRPGGHSLDSWGERLGFPKGAQPDFSRFSVDMLEYCRQDARVCERVWAQVNKELADFSEESIQLELDTGAIIGQQKFRGWLLDARACAELLGEIRELKFATMDECHATFRPLPKFVREVTPKVNKDGSMSVVGLKYLGENCLELVGGPHSRLEWEEFNLGSNKQIGERLVRAGWKPTEFTDGGQPKVDEETLEGVEGIPEVELICRYLMLQKREGMLSSWLEELGPDGRMHGGVHSCGAVTRRMTHFLPNMAQVTGNGKPYGRRMRECWIAKEGYKIVGVDADQLELVCLAHYMNDADYIKTVAEGRKEDESDVHNVNKRAAGLDSRDAAKTFIYAFLYGAGNAKIGAIVGGSRREGAGIKRRFLAGLPALESLQERVERAGRIHGRLRLLDGGFVRAEGSYMDLNRLLQGTGAIIMKKALVILNEDMKKFKIRGGFVGNIHDEIQAEIHVDDTVKYSILAERAITKAGEALGLRCPLRGTAKIGDSWAETH